MSVENPKNPGDRAYGHGDQISVEANAAVSKGQWAKLDGAGGIDPVVEVDPTDVPDDLVVVKHSAETGEGTTAHLRGVVRAGILEDSGTTDGVAYPYPVVREYDVDDSALYVLR